MQRRYDIVIVGAGIAGLTTACSLIHQFSNKGVKLPSVALLDPAPLSLTGAELKNLVDGYDPRVSALTQYSCERFAEMGVWEQVNSQRSADFVAMSVWDGEGTAAISFDTSRNNADRLGAVVENSVLCHALLKKLLDAGCIDILNEVMVDECKVMGAKADSKAQGTQLDLSNGDILSAELVIAADGAKSMMRSAADIETREWDYNHDAIVCTVETEKEHQNTAWQCFTKYGPLAFLPLGEAGNGQASRRFSSIVWSQTRDQAQALMAISEQEFIDELERAFESRLGAVLACSKRFSFPLRQRHAVDYYRNGVVLVGDAAHSIHPLAGQGINLGIKDAIRLAEQLATDVARGKAPGSSRALGRYSRARKTDNLAMMAAMEGFKRLFSPLPPEIITLRNRGMAFTDRQKWLKQKIVGYAMGIE